MRVPFIGPAGGAVRRLRLVKRRFGRKAGKRRAPVSGTVSGAAIFEKTGALLRPPGGFEGWTCSAGVLLRPGGTVPLEGDGMSTAFLVLAVSSGVAVIAVAGAAVLVVLLVTVSMRGRQKRGAKERGEARRDESETREAGREERRQKRDAKERGEARRDESETREAGREERDRDIAREGGEDPGPDR
jgi:hypothetical protein